MFFLQFVVVFGGKYHFTPSHQYVQSQKNLFSSKFTALVKGVLEVKFKTVWTIACSLHVHDGCLKCHLSTPAHATNMLFRELVMLKCCQVWTSMWMCMQVCNVLAPHPGFCPILRILYSHLIPSVADISFGYSGMLTRIKRLLEMNEYSSCNMWGWFQVWLGIK